jgi:hypothetical protein
MTTTTASQTLLLNPRRIILPSSVEKKDMGVQHNPADMDDWLFKSHREAQTDGELNLISQPRLSDLVPRRYQERAKVLEDFIVENFDTSSEADEDLALQALHYLLVDVSQRPPPIIVPILQRLVADPAFPIDQVAEKKQGYLTGHILDTMPIRERPIRQRRLQLPFT